MTREAAALRQPPATTLSSRAPAEKGTSASAQSSRWARPLAGHGAVKSCRANHRAAPHFFAAASVPAKAAAVALRRKRAIKGSPGGRGLAGGARGPGDARPPRSRRDDRCLGGWRRYPDGPVRGARARAWRQLGSARIRESTLPSSGDRASSRPLEACPCWAWGSAFR